MPELLVLPLQLLHDDTMRLARVPDGKELVHVLKRDTLSLRDQKVHKRNRQDHERRKEEVHPVAHGVEHLRCKARDDEVPEPVAGGGRRLAEGARVLGEHFRVDDPGRAVPAGRVEGGPQVEEEDGGDAATRQLGLGLGVGAADADEGADDPHADRAAGSTDHEELGAAETVDQPEEPDDSHDGLDDAEDARGEEAGVGAGDPNRLEDGGGVVVLEGISMGKSDVGE